MALGTCFVSWLLPGLEWNWPTLVAANLQNTHAMYQVTFMKRLLRMNK
jgi:hypothetical protein